MNRSLLVALVALSAAALGCALDESGLAPDGGAEASPLDAPSDVPIDVPPIVCADAGPSSCAVAAAQEFRKPLLFSADAGTLCPSGYLTQDLVYAQHAPACTCTCMPGSTPSCDTSVAHYDEGIVDCTLGSGTITTSCNGNLSLSFTAAFTRFDPPAVVGGCTGGSSSAPPLTTSNVRLCLPACDSDESACSAQTGLQACVYVVGDVPSCPPDYANGPFYVGDTPSIQCDGCSCGPKGDCSASTLHVYTSSTDCSSGDRAFAMDGTCNAMVATVGASAKIDPLLKGYQCSVSPGAAHTQYGSNAVTVCCK